MTLLHRIISEGEIERWRALSTFQGFYQRDRHGRGGFFLETMDLANNRQEEGFNDKWLNMVFGSVEWFLEFDKSVVKHLMSQSCDHSMVLLASEPQQ